MEKIREPNKLNLDPATVKLAGTFVGSLIIYVLMFTLPANLLKLYDRIGLDGHLLQDGGVLAYVRMILAFAGLALLYVMGIRAAGQTRNKAAWIIVIAGTLAFILVLLFMAPFDALDIYDNIFHGRIMGIYGGNPFRQLIADFPKDPFFKYPRWKTSPSAYGPVWEMLAGLMARLAGNGILGNVLAFKLLPGIFHLASVAAIVVFLRRTAPDHALSGALLLGWNPVVLYETWGNGHNDIAMVFWVLLAAVWISRKRYTLATLSLITGALVKFIPILLIPAALLAGCRNLEKPRSRLRFLSKTLLAAISMIVVAYFPFWNGFASFSVSRRMQMFTTSIPAMIYRFLKPTIGLTESAWLVSLGALGLLVIFTLYQSFHVNEQEPLRDFSSTAFNILAFYLMVTCLWFQQWYSLWLIGLASLLSEHSRRLALLFGFYVLSKQMIFGPLIVPMMATRPETRIWLEPLLTLAVLGVPWIYALRNLQLSKRTRKEIYAT
jgi:glycosyl transferase family 87